eukprot:jgi/Mesvir1/4896/Mv11162-RA.6
MVTDSPQPANPRLSLPLSHEEDSGSLEHRVILVMTVEIEDGRSATIEVHDGDDPAEVAARFCAAHGLAAQIVEPLTEHLCSSVAALAVNANGEGDQTTLGGAGGMTPGPTTGGGSVQPSPPPGNLFPPEDEEHRFADMAGIPRGGSGSISKGSGGSGMYAAARTSSFEQLELALEEQGGEANASGALPAGSSLAPKARGVIDLSDEDALAAAAATGNTFSAVPDEGPSGAGGGKSEKPGPERIASKDGGLELPGTDVSAPTVRAPTSGITRTTSLNTGAGVSTQPTGGSTRPVRYQAAHRGRRASVGVVANVTMPPDADVPSSSSRVTPNKSRGGAWDDMGAARGGRRLSEAAAPGWTGVSPVTPGAALGRDRDAAAARKAGGSSPSRARLGSLPEGRGDGDGPGGHLALIQEGKSEELGLAASMAMAEVSSPENRGGRAERDKSEPSGVKDKEKDKDRQAGGGKGERGGREGKGVGTGAGAGGKGKPPVDAQELAAQASEALEWARVVSERRENEQQQRKDKDATASAHKRDASVFHRLYEQARDASAQKEAARTRQLEQEEASHKEGVTLVSTTSRAMMRGRTASEFDNYGERLYVEGLLGLQKKAEAAEAMRKEQEGAAKQHSYKPKISNHARQIHRSKGETQARLLQQLESRHNHSQLQQRLIAAKLETDEKEMAECTFRPRTNPRSQRMMAAREEALRAHRISFHEQLYHDADRRRSRQQLYQNWFPNDYTFCPDLVGSKSLVNDTSRNTALGAANTSSLTATNLSLFSEFGVVADGSFMSTTSSTALSGNAGVNVSKYGAVEPPEGDFFERLAVFEQRKEQKTLKLLEEERIDPATGKPFFTPSTGRGPQFQRNSEGLPIGDFLYQHREDADIRRYTEGLGRQHQEAMQRRESAAADARSTKMIRRLMRRAFRVVFDLLDTNRDGLVPLSQAPLELLPRAVQEDVAEVAARWPGENPIPRAEFVELLADVTKDTSRGPRVAVYAELQHSVARQAKPSAVDEMSRELTFRPAVSKRSKVLAARRRVKGVPVYDQLTAERAQALARIQELKAAAERDEMKECTFKPAMTGVGSSGVKGGDVSRSTGKPCKPCTRDDARFDALQQEVRDMLDAAHADHLAGTGKDSGDGDGGQRKGKRPASAGTTPAKGAGRAGGPGSRHLSPLEQLLEKEAEAGGDGDLNDDDSGEAYNNDEAARDLSAWWHDDDGSSSSSAQGARVQAQQYQDFAKELDGLRLAEGIKQEEGGEGGDAVSFAPVHGVAPLPFVTQRQGTGDGVHAEGGAFGQQSDPADVEDSWAQLVQARTSAEGRLVAPDGIVSPSKHDKGSRGGGSGSRGTGNAAAPSQHQEGGGRRASKGLPSSAHPGGALGAIPGGGDQGGEEDEEVAVLRQLQQRYSIGRLRELLATEEVGEGGGGGGSDQNVHEEPGAGRMAAARSKGPAAGGGKTGTARAGSGSLKHQAGASATKPASGKRAPGAVAHSGSERGGSKVQPRSGAGEVRGRGRGGHRGGEGLGGDGEVYGGEHGDDVVHEEMALEMWARQSQLMASMLASDTSASSGGGAGGGANGADAEALDVDVTDY